MYTEDEGNRSLRYVGTLILSYKSHNVEGYHLINTDCEGLWVSSLTFFQSFEQKCFKIISVYTSSVLLNNCCSKSTVEGFP